MASARRASCSRVKRGAGPGLRGSTAGEECGSCATDRVHSTQMPDRLQITPNERLDVLERTPAALVLEAAYAPGGKAPPAHYHPAQDEHFDILEGVLRVEVAGVERDVHADETLDIPRGTPHRMWNPHSRPARARWETRPAGRTEAWFTALAELQGTGHVDDHGTPRPLPFAALAHAYRDTFRLAAGPQPATRLAVAALAGAARATGRAPHPSGRDLGALSGPLAGLAFLGGLVVGVAVADDPYPRPGTRPARVRRYFQANARAARISATGQLLSAGLLARFTATVARLARESARSRTLPAATTAAGAAAAASLATSAAISLALTGHAGTRKRTAAALHRRLFIAGGPIHTAAFGVLVGCLSLAARRSGHLPPALTTAGLASTAAGALSPLALAIEPAVLLIPAGRMSGLVVIAIAGTRLSHMPATAHHHPATE
jgi:mannose-6-phosphate isomerase-like protein (cupin superfamily)